jgi:hypothetical protein
VVVEEELMGMAVRAVAAKEALAELVYHHPLQEHLLIMLEEVVGWERLPAVLLAVARLLMVEELERPRPEPSVILEQTARVAVAVAVAVLRAPVRKAVPVVQV